MAIETNELIDVKTLSPFKKFIMTIGNLPTSYLESMTYAELLMWFCNYLQETVIPTVNNNAEAVEELQGLYEQLEDYVNEYFENLNVQTEINNKLDTMAQDGTLTNLIKDYVDPIYSAYESEINDSINAIQTQVNAVASGSPLVASSTAGMTETDRVYVNTTNGKWYYYDGDSWEIGGTYQSTGLDDNSVIQANLVPDLKTTINTRNVTPTWTSGSYRNATGNVSSLSNSYVSNPIQVYANETIYFKCKGHSNFTIICLVNNDNSRIANSSSMSCVTPSNANTNMTLYSYTAKQDLLISLCYYEDYDYLYIAKNENKDPITTLKDAVGYRIPSYTFTNGKYINHVGGLGNLVSYCYTSPIELKKNEVISFSGVGTANSVSMITLCDENGDNRTPLIICTDGSQLVYKYQAVSDCYVILSGRITPFENVAIYKNENNNAYNTFSTLLTVGCIGDSLASGESAYTDGGETEYVDLYDYSWPQFMAKLTGNTYYNFSKGGLSTRSWLTSNKGASLAFDGDHTCTGYIIGLGVNDVVKLGQNYLGASSDIDTSDYHNNGDSFYGNYARIIQMIQENQPKAKIFILTMPRDDNSTFADFNTAIRYMATVFDNVYVIDLFKYYLEEFQSGFIENNKTSGHYNAIAYQYIGQLLLNELNNYMMKNYTEFKDVQFIGTEYYLS